MSVSRLTIIIPAYNEGPTIRHILDQVASVSLQGEVSKEIILINDCSTDDTEAHILSFKDEHPKLDIHYLKHEKNQGKGAAIHTGIAHAKGEYLIIQDADLEYDPQRIQFIAPTYSRPTC